MHEVETKKLSGYMTAPLAAQSAASGQREHAVLVVLDGRRTSRRYEIRKAEFAVGREEACDLVLHDVNCSRRHASFTFLNLDKAGEPPRIKLTDLDSRNGCYVNGELVHSKELKSGDKILLGHTLLGFYLWDDVTLRAEDSLLRNASTDQLTGLYNRGFFQSTLTREFHRAIRYQRPLSLLFVDLDNFKSINDGHGHQVGDKVLTEVAAFIQATSRGNDFACRYGGDEIVLILPETDLESGNAFASRLREKLKRLEVRLSHTTIHLTASFGLGVLDPSMKQPEDLLKLADDAIYKAKREGRDRICTLSLADPELNLTRPLRVYREE